MTLQTDPRAHDDLWNEPGNRSHYDVNTADCLHLRKISSEIGRTHEAFVRTTISAYR